MAAMTLEHRKASMALEEVVEMALEHREAPMTLEEMVEMALEHRRCLWELQEMVEMALEHREASMTLEDREASLALVEAAKDSWKRWPCRVSIEGCRPARTTAGHLATLLPVPPWLASCHPPPR